MSSKATDPNTTWDQAPTSEILNSMPPQGTTRENPAVCKYTGNKYYRQATCRDLNAGC